MIKRIFVFSLVLLQSSLFAYSDNINFKNNDCMNNFEKICIYNKKTGKLKLLKNKNILNKYKLKKNIIVLIDEECNTEDELIF